MLVDWMRGKGLVDDGQEQLNGVADHHLYLHKNERKTLLQAITTHDALRRAKRHDEADRLTLADIVEQMELAGFYSTLLAEWLPRIFNSRCMKTKIDSAIVLTSEPIDLATLLFEAIIKV